MERKILKRMNRLGLWKSKHMRIENAMGGIPGHELGEVKKTISKLMQKGFVVYYNKSKKAIQLNFNKYKEIMDLIQNGNNEY